MIIDDPKMVVQSGHIAIDAAQPFSMANKFAELIEYYAIFLSSICLTRYVPAYCPLYKLSVHLKNRKFRSIHPF